MSKKILLIEDEEVLSRAIAAELKSAGFRVSRAFDGEEGLKQALNIKPDLILLDLMLPKKNGFEVLEELKKSPTTKDIVVIIITALDQDEEIKKGLKLGADDYFVKSQHALGEIIEKVNDFFTSSPSDGARDEISGEAGYHPRIIDLRESKRKK